MIEIKGDQRPTILALSIAFPIISILSVILRFEARRVKRIYIEADDWTILAALVRCPTTSLGNFWIVVAKSYRSLHLGLRMMSFLVNLPKRSIAKNRVS